MRYLQLVWVHLRFGLLTEFQYRANFFVQLFQSLLKLGTGLAALLLVFQHTTTLGGWGENDLLAIMGVHIAVGGIIRMLIQPNMERLMTDIREGTFDFVLTKPADAQVMASIRDFRLWQGVDILTGIAVMVTALVRRQSAVGLVETLLFAVALFLGAVMIYSVWLMLTTLAFWIISADTITELFDSMYQAGRWPTGVYPTWLRSGLTFLVPIAFAVTVPAEALTERLELGTLALAAGFALVLVVLARLIWRLGVRSYAGASA